MGLGVGGAPKGRSATRAYLGLIGELPRVNSRASLLAQTPPTGMRALPDPPQHTQRRDPALTSTCRRAWSEQLARDVGCSCTSRRRLCSLRPPGGFHERYEGAKGTGNDGGGGVLREQSSESHLEGRRAAAAGSLTSTSLCELGTAGSQRRRPNARWAAVGEASEASRDADVTVVHAHAQRHGCLSARWAQTCAPGAERRGVVASSL